MRLRYAPCGALVVAGRVGTATFMDEPRFGFDHRDYDITAGRAAGLRTALIR